MCHRCLCKELIWGLFSDDSDINYWVFMKCQPYYDEPSIKLKHKIGSSITTFKFIGQDIEQLSEKFGFFIEK